VRAPDAPAPAGAQDLSALHSSARTQWQRGDTTAALTTLASALKLQPRDSQTRAIADEFVRQAGAQSSSAEQLARDAGAGETAKFATRRRAPAKQSVWRAAVNRRQPIRAYLDTVTIFAEAANEPKPRRHASSATGGRAAASPLPAVTKLVIQSPYPVFVTVGGQSHWPARSARAHVPGRSSDDRADCSAGLHAADAAHRRSAGATHSETCPAAVPCDSPPFRPTRGLPSTAGTRGTCRLTIAVAIGPAILEFAWPDNRQQRLTVSIASEGQTIFGEAPKK
jgi:hypothetical protein